MSQSATEVLKKLQDHRLRFFTTADVMALTAMTPSAASQSLNRLAGRGLLVSMKRGVWANQRVESIDPLEAVPYLIAPWPGYVSLYTALSRHGLIDEVPQSIFAISGGRAQRYRTPLGNFQIHHLPRHLIWGFGVEHSGQSSFPMAEPEKAFLDLAYLGLIPRSPLGMPYKRDGRWKLNRPKLAQFANRYRFPPLVNYLRKNNLL